MDFVSYSQGNSPLRGEDHFAEIFQRSFKLPDLDIQKKGIENELASESSEQHNIEYNPSLTHPDNTFQEEAKVSDINPSRLPSFTIQYEKSNSMEEEHSNEGLGKLYDDHMEPRWEENQQEEPTHSADESAKMVCDELQQTQATEPQPSAIPSSELIKQLLDPENYTVDWTRKSSTFKVSVKLNETISKLLADLTKGSDPKKNDAKNFPKKFGDQLSDFLANEKNLVASKKLFKDKTSWKILNAYCSGESRIPMVSHKAFIKMVFEFVRLKNIEELQNAKSEVAAKFLHMANFMCTKLACKKIEDSKVDYESITFKRGFPATVIECEL